MDPLYTTHDVAQLLQVDPSTVSKWIDRNILMAFRTPGGHRRVRQPDLVDFLRKHDMPIPAELGASRVQIIAVDDERIALDALKRAFKPYASQVELHTTTSGVEALLMAAEIKPHGFILDLHMPDLDGIEVCKSLRARPAFEGTRVIMVTGRHTQEAIGKSLAAGAAACLSKPVDVTAVMDLLRVPIAMARSAG
jgi:excisionase family DNA binding protein